MNDAGGGLMTVPIAGVSGNALPCRQVDPELFFAEVPADVEEAKALCRDCPIREACLAGAIERREPWGVWGGELFVGGVVVARKRPRGRPRKYPVADPYAPAARQGEAAA
jgi:WhiB family transcriptional regulator, redox-sensing transcriptional regulator